MQVKAKAKYVRISPRKARLVIDSVRGFDLQRAFNQLALLNKKGARLVTKLLKSAMANAEHNYSIDKNNLFIKKITVDDGPTFYRWLPRAFGRATPLRKRTSIISVVLDEKALTRKQTKVKHPKIETVKVENKRGGEIQAEKVESTAKGPAVKDADVGHQEEYFDMKRKGGYRDMQQAEKKTQKEKGLFKKMFRRKSGM